MKLKNDFLDALLKEIVLRKNYANNEEECTAYIDTGGANYTQPEETEEISINYAHSREIEKVSSDYVRTEKINTIYFGGGTPSLLTARELATIMDHLAKNFSIDTSAEITLEANPDDISIEAVAGWKKEGINRLSIGIQSFFEEDLKWMNRAHTANQAINCIKQAQDADITNMSIDLIYGTPGLTDENWISNLNTAVSLQVPHLSCYALTVEPGTALDHMTRTKKVVNVNSEDQARQFLLMTDFLQNKGYEHYEISNLSLPGKRSKHNSSYWSGAKYIGLGPSAHSYNGKSRQWNIANNALYIQSLKNNQLSFEIEYLSEQQQLNEYIMTSLRTMEGLDLVHVEKKFGIKYIEKMSSAVKPFIDKKWIEFSSGKWVLTREGKLFADGISAELFVD